jgi:hypothetical protein
MPTTRNDLATRLLVFLLEKIPGSLEPWGQAVLAELAVIEGFRARVQWSLGGAIALITGSIRLVAGPCGPEEDRRLDVSLIVGYQFLFSAMLMGALTWQLPRITESWSYVVPALIICYAQPWTGFFRAAAPASSDGNTASVESALIGESLPDFGDLPDLEKLLGRTDLSDLENLSDLDELLDLEAPGSAGTFLPAKKSECGHPLSQVQPAIDHAHRRSHVEAHHEF